MTYDPEREAWAHIKAWEESAIREHPAIGLAAALRAAHEAGRREMAEDVLAMVRAFESTAHVATVSEYLARALISLAESET